MFSVLIYRLNAAASQSRSHITSEHRDCLGSDTMQAGTWCSLVCGDFTPRRCWRAGLGRWSCAYWGLLSCPSALWLVQHWPHCL